MIALHLSVLLFLVESRALRSTQVMDAFDGCRLYCVSVVYFSFSFCCLGVFLKRFLAAVQSRVNGITIGVVVVVEGFILIYFCTLFVGSRR